MRLGKAADWVWVEIQGCRNMIFTAFNSAREYASIKGMFLVILGSYGGPLGSWMCSMASLDVGEIGGSGRLDLGRNLGPPILT